METTEKQETALTPTLQLTPFEQTKENLIALASDYKNMVVTKDNMKEANEARLVLYRKRIEIQNVAKANRKTIKEFLKNNNDATEEELIGTIEPTELALEAKIKTIKDAIAEEERIEATRIAKHKAALDNISNETVKATNSIDMLYLKAINDTVLTDLEEFQAEGEQLLSALKETAKNRLELLEFQAKKKAEQDAYELQIAREEKAKKDLEEKEAQKGFDMLGPTQTIMEVATKMQEEVIETVSKINEVIDNSPKLSPLKTVPIGAVSEQKPIINDKQILEFISNKLTNLSQDIIGIPCIGKKAVEHKNFLVNMLSKLSEQTLKVAEKL